MSWVAERGSGLVPTERESGTMDVISQFIVDLSWGLTFGALIAVGIVVAEAAGYIVAGIAAIGLVWFVWRRVRRRKR